jgi:hypothetical protein
MNHIELIDYNLHDKTIFFDTIGLYDKSKLYYRTLQMYKYTTHTNQIYTILILFQTNVVSKKTINMKKKKEIILKQLLIFCITKPMNCVSDMCPNIPLNFFKTVKKMNLLNFYIGKKNQTFDLSLIWLSLYHVP